MEQRREALTEREALGVIFGGIYVQCNKCSPLAHCGLRTVPPLAKLGGEFGTRAYRNISQM